MTRYFKLSNLDIPDNPLFDTFIKRVSKVLRQFVDHLYVMELFHRAEKGVKTNKVVLDEQLFFFDTATFNESLKQTDLNFEDGLVHSELWDVFEKRGNIISFRDVLNTADQLVTTLITQEFDISFVEGYRFDDLIEFQKEIGSELSFIDNVTFLEYFDVSILKQHFAVTLLDQLRYDDEFVRTEHETSPKVSFIDNLGVLDVFTVQGLLTNILYAFKEGLSLDEYYEKRLMLYENRLCSNYKKMVESGGGEVLDEKATCRWISALYDETNQPRYLPDIGYVEMLNYGEVFGLNTTRMPDLMLNDAFGFEEWFSVYHEDIDSVYHFVDSIGVSDIFEVQFDKSHTNYYVDGFGFRDLLTWNTELKNRIYNQDSFGITDIFETNIETTVKTHYTDNVALFDIFSWQVRIDDDVYVQDSFGLTDIFDISIEVGKTAVYSDMFRLGDIFNWMVETGRMSEFMDMFSISDHFVKRYLQYEKSLYSAYVDMVHYGGGEILDTESTQRWITTLYDEYNNPDRLTRLKFYDEVGLSEDIGIEKDITTDVALHDRLGLGDQFYQNMVDKNIIHVSDSFGLADEFRSTTTSDSKLFFNDRITVDDTFGVVSKKVDSMLSVSDGIEFGDLFHTQVEQVLFESFMDGLVLGEFVGVTGVNVNKNFTFNEIFQLLEKYEQKYLSYEKSLNSAYVEMVESGGGQINDKLATYRWISTLYDEYDNPDKRHKIEFKDRFGANDTFLKNQTIKGNLLLFTDSMFFNEVQTEPRLKTEFVLSFNESLNFEEQQ